MKRIAIAIVLLISFSVIGCRDQAPTPLPPVTPAAAPSTGYWQVDSDTNPVTGEITKSAYLKYQGK
jgi:hypothetical protein